MTSRPSFSDLTWFLNIVQKDEFDRAVRAHLDGGALPDVYCRVVGDEHEEFKSLLGRAAHWGSVPSVEALLWAGARVYWPRTLLPAKWAKPGAFDTYEAIALDPLCCSFEIMAALACERWDNPAHFEDNVGSHWRVCELLMDHGASPTRMDVGGMPGPLERMMIQVSNQIEGDIPPLVYDWILQCTHKSLLWLAEHDNFDEIQEVAQANWQKGRFAGDTWQEDYPLLAQHITAQAQGVFLDRFAKPGVVRPSTRL